MTSTTDLYRQVAFVAADLDRRQYPMAGIVRQAARALLEAPEPEGDGCRGCGAALVQPETGRRRSWCSESCRRRHRR